MNFERQIDGWSEMSGCGQYSVAIACVHDRFVHTAYFLGVKPAQILGVRGNIDDAREVCREHARKAAK